MLFTLQRYEFFSKSQLIIDGTLRKLDVVYPTKVRIFQQITTQQYANIGIRGMLFTLQRYEFFSKSQLIISHNYLLIRCCLPYKGTNFSANHNCETACLFSRFDVVYPTKVRIFQQITTIIQSLKK